MSEKLERNKAYPLKDYHPLERKLKLGAVWTGEFREPRKGEWFLSGSDVEAYHAKSDMSTAYHIAKVVHVTIVRSETYEEVAQ